MGGGPAPSTMAQKSAWWNARSGKRSLAASTHSILISTPIPRQPAIVVTPSTTRPSPQPRSRNVVFASRRARRAIESNMQSGVCTTGTMHPSGGTSSSNRSRVFSVWDSVARHRPSVSASWAFTSAAFVWAAMCLSLVLRVARLLCDALMAWLCFWLLHLSQALIAARRGRSRARQRETAAPAVLEARARRRDWLRRPPT
mmetsp:Transcript_12039/g.36011  ORF Transcript_12039/g.36011 Transcript_12039/m.36011 type:complete len:200 (-) Transcript_12039:7-606(-)